MTTTTTIMFALMCSLFALANGNLGDRHVIYWNAAMTPKLTNKDFVMDVKIGQFMDVLCPQRSLMGITNGPRELSTFDLYNVTEDEFDQCKTGGRRNFIFACDRPERENKLTIKFQLISPSPLGFRFQHCQDYYFVASPRGRRTKSGCHKDFTKLHIKVACKEEPTTSTTTTTTTTTTPTTLTPTTKPMKKIESKFDLVKRLREAGKRNTRGHNERNVPEETIVVPDMIDISGSQDQMLLNNNSPRVLASSGSIPENNGGHNAASHNVKSSKGMYILSLVAVFISCTIFNNISTNAST